MKNTVGSTDSGDLDRQRPEKKSAYITQEHIELFLKGLGKANTGRLIKRVFTYTPTPEERIKYLWEWSWYNFADNHHPFSNTSHAEWKTEKEKEQEKTRKYNHSDKIVLHMSKIQTILTTLWTMPHFPQDTAICIRDLTDFEGWLWYYYSSFVRGLQDARSKEVEISMRSNLKRDMQSTLTEEQLQSFRISIVAACNSIEKLFTIGKKKSEEKILYNKEKSVYDSDYQQALKTYRNYIKTHQISYIYDKPVTEYDFPEWLNNEDHPIITHNRLCICNGRIKYRLLNQPKISRVLKYVLSYRWDDLDDQETKDLQTLLDNVSDPTIVQHTNRMLMLWSSLIHQYGIGKLVTRNNWQKEWVRLSHIEIQQALSAQATDQD